MQVTVAIPTYKTRNTIFKLLDSLLAQSYSNFGIMVVYKPRRQPASQSLTLASSQ